MRKTYTAAASAVFTCTLLFGCGRGDSSSAGGGGGANDSSLARGTSGAAGSSTASGDTIVRGTVTAVSDSVLTLTTPSGEVRVALAPKVKVYARSRGELSRVTDNAFVGVTSVLQPDGTQRATEIHIFPEELRGLGEGSRPMGSAASGGRSTMTNGSVGGSRMTNGSAQMTNGAARMTNGTSRGAASGTISVAYNGGSQTITVPAGVEVTVIAPTDAKLTPGASVVIPGTRRPDGSISTSRVMLAGGSTPTK